MTEKLSPVSTQEHASPMVRFGRQAGDHRHEAALPAHLEKHKNLLESVPSVNIVGGVPAEHRLEQAGATRRYSVMSEVFAMNTR